QHLRRRGSETDRDGSRPDGGDDARPEPRRRRRREPELDRGLVGDARQRHLPGGAHHDAAVSPDRWHRSGRLLDLVRPLVGSEPRRGADGVPLPLGLDGLRPRRAEQHDRVLTRNQVGERTLKWLLDRISFGPVSVATQDPKKAAKGSKKVRLSTSAISSSGAPIVRYRW